MRKALVVGINHYEYGNSLHGCVNDAVGVKAVLERHADGSVNFSVKSLTAAGPGDRVERAELKQAVRDVFAGDEDVALFYFAGHGHIEPTGGYVLSSESKTGDDGLPLAEVITLANQSRVRNKIVILDSCHSGIAAASPTSQSSELSEGLTILTASTADQYASEGQSGGIFTGLLIDALSGAAGNLVGDVTPGSVYAHIDQSLGPWDQRPVFKTNVKSFVSLRKVQAPIELSDLRRIVEFFPEPGRDFALDPSFEPERTGHETGVPAPNPLNTQNFRILQKFNRIGLVVPVDAPHMWHAAMGNKSCKLTVLGEHYRRLVAQKRI